MRLLFLLLGNLGWYFAAHGQAPVHTWNHIAAAARACSVKLERVQLPKSFDTVPHGPAYRFHPSAKSAARECFYEKLGMPEAERVVREMQFDPLTIKAR